MFISGFLPFGKDTNKLVKTFIISETLLWSGHNFIFPIVALFIAGSIKNGSVQIAATAFSLYLLTRVFLELLSGKYLVGTSIKKKMLLLIFGYGLLSIAYLSFALTETILHLFVNYIVVGLGMGISTPAKLAIFSTHLDKNKEPKEWGYYDAVPFLGMAIAGIIAGYIAKEYGFSPVFIAASLINLLGILPYIFFFKKYVDR